MIRLSIDELKVLDNNELHDYLDSLSKEDKKELFSSLKDNEVAVLFERLDEIYSSNLLKEIDSDHINHIFSLMNIDKAISLINDLTEEERSQYISKIDPSILKKIEGIKSSYLDMHPKDVALELEDMTEEERKDFFHLFNSLELATFFNYLDVDDAAEFIQELSDDKASNILENMDIDDAVDVINNLDDDIKTSYLGLMDSEIKEELSNLSLYDENSAASIMDTNYIEIDGLKDVKDAMKELVKNAPSASTITTLFVNVEKKFYGVVDFKKLIVTKSPCLVKDIAIVNCKTVDVNDSVDYVLNVVDDYDIYALPVLENDMLVGIVTIDDALARLNEEKENDYNKLAGISGEDEDDDYLKSQIKNRLPWLLLLLVLDIFVCLVISRFENVISSFTILVLFEPIILGLSGNVGTQSLAVCVRSISNSELDTRGKKFRHVIKELRNGIVIGLIVGVCLFIISYLYVEYIKKSSSFSSEYLSLVVSLSIVASITFSSLFGCLIPIVLSSLNIDPASASGPLITTINDILSIVIYFSLATLLLIGV